MTKSGVATSGVHWDRLGDVLLKQGLPLLAGAIHPGFGVAAKLVASEIGGDPQSPDELARRLESADAASIARLKALEERNRHELERLVIENETARMTEINRTMRVESRSNDPYVRRWRPTLGYIFAIEMALLFGGLFYVVVFRTDKAIEIITAAANLGWIIGVQAAVLGVSVVQRSNDKKVAAGQPTGLVNGLANLLHGGAK